MKEKQNIKIALIQMSMGPRVKDNLAKASSMMRIAARRGAEIVCLPELFTTPYFPQEERGEGRRYAERIPGPTTRALSRLAADLGTVIVAPLYEVTEEEGYYNTAVVIDGDGALLGSYRKMHIPHDPLFYERHYFREGDLGFKVIETPLARIAPLVCFDQWFPEAARISALQGAEVIFYPTAIGWIRGHRVADDWRDAWVTIQRSHAIANGIYVAAVNRCGREGKLDFWGSSFVCDPFGRVLSRAGRKEEIVTAEIDLSENERIRHDWGFFVKRRPNAYGALQGGAYGTMQRRSPKSLGYHMPAEWSQHRGVFLAWPHDRTTFPRLERVERTYLRIMGALQRSGSEDVHLMVTGPGMRRRVEALAGRSRLDGGRLHFYEHDYADVWFRDYGPTFVIKAKDRTLGMINWTFNAWGGKYRELLKDDDVPPFLNKFFNFPFFEPGMVMEGGSFEVNGRGTLLTTEQCLLNSNRNPSMGRRQIEDTLKENLGVSKVIWLRNGIRGDDTDAHIDNLARFVDERTVVCPVADDARDGNYRNLKENHDILKASRDQDGRSFSVVTLPSPRVRAGRRVLPASYCNFYIANRAVLVPQFGLSTDSEALAVLGECFPGRTTVGIDCSDLVGGSGTLHCISQQIPRP